MRVLEHNKKIMAMALLGACTVAVIVWNVMLAKGPSTPPLPPQGVTHDRLLRLTAMASSFVTQEKRMPDSLSELKDSSVMNDGWGKAFAFKCKAKGNVMECEIRSGGADGQVGNEDDQYSQLTFGPDPYGGVMMTSDKLVPEQPN